MKNEYLKNLSKIEFVLTDACTGRCKHCSRGEHRSRGVSIDPRLAAEVVEKVAAEYDIKTVMTFGGEPLLHLDAVVAVMEAAVACEIPVRQVITNGFVTKDPEKIGQIAQRLAASGVNDLLLSVDAFHQETIPLSVVKIFAGEVKRCGIPLRLQPAWLVSEEDDNPYNRITREILDAFSDLKIPVGSGNVIFPEGNARKYLAEYLKEKRVENPYLEDPRDVRCLSVSENGDVLSGNVLRRDILEIVRDYAP